MAYAHSYEWIEWLVSLRRVGPGGLNSARDSRAFEVILVDGMAELTPLTGGTPVIVETQLSHQRFETRRAAHVLEPGAPEEEQIADLGLRAQRLQGQLGIAPLSSELRQLYICRGRA